MLVIDDLNALVSFVEINEIEQITFYDGRKILDNHNFYPSPDAHNFIYIITSDNKVKEIVSDLIKSIEDISDYKWIIRKESRWGNVPAQIELKPESLKGADAICLYIPPQKIKMGTSRFIELVGHLRSPEGCPWDRKQTHQSLRTNLLEETYEVLDAIDEEDNDHLLEELGDLLLQIVLHAQIAREEGAFEYGNVVNNIYKKIYHRHPHVFKKTEINNVKDVMTNWEKIKAKERESDLGKENQSILGSIPGQLPSLSMAQKYQERAARVGFDWEDISPVYKKIFEEIDEVKNASSQKELESELGDLLFAVVNLVRWSGFDAEASLRLTNKKFRKRFQYIEKKISDNGQILTDASLSEMDDLWNEAKLKEH